MTGKVCAHVFVSGRVQGVFFRAETKKTADSLGVSGWVKNLPDGRVEAVFEGDEDTVKKAIEWCRSGSGYSRVDDIEIEWEPPSGEHESFEIKY